MLDSCTTKDTLRRNTRVYFGYDKRIILQPDCGTEPVVKMNTTPGYYCAWVTDYSIRPLQTIHSEKRFGCLFVVIFALIAGKIHNSLALRYLLFREMGRVFSMIRYCE
jgi:hypothetical protein